MGKTNHNYVTICHLNGGKNQRDLGHKSGQNKFLGLVEYPIPFTTQPVSMLFLQSDRRV